MGTRTVRVAPTLVAAEAARFKLKSRPPTIRTRTASTTINRIGPRPLFFTGVAGAAMRSGNLSSRRLDLGLD